MTVDWVDIRLSFHTIIDYSLYKSPTSKQYTSFFPTKPRKLNNQQKSTCNTLNCPQRLVLNALHPYTSLFPTKLLQLNTRGHACEPYQHVSTCSTRNRSRSCTPCKPCISTMQDILPHRRSFVPSPLLLYRRPNSFLMIFCCVLYTRGEQEDCRGKIKGKVV